MEGNLREREEGRKGGRVIFFHCMSAAALISWSVSVNSFREETAYCVIRKRSGKLCFPVPKSATVPSQSLSAFPYVILTAQRVNL